MTKTCAWCRYFARDLAHWASLQGHFTAARDGCWVDGEDTTQYSTCGAWAPTLFLPKLWEEVKDVSAHERAELLRIKNATYRYSQNAAAWGTIASVPPRRR